MDEMISKLNKIIKNKKDKEEFVDKLLILRSIQTIEEYIADNLTPSTKHEKIKAKARIEAYEDCINILKEIL